MNIKKGLATHLIFAFLFFALATVLRRWFDVSYLTFWIGALIGSVIPDIDHLIYVYFLRPHELTSQRATKMMNQGDLTQTVNLLSATTQERKSLVFHTAMFQVIFALFSFFVISSSSNLFGRGLVVAFLLHLVVDQFVDLVQSDSLNLWLTGLKIQLNKKETTLYWVANLLVVVYFGFVI